MLRLALFVSAAVYASAAVAADTPVIGPVPAWVRPIEVPVVKPSEEDVRVLLEDQQIRFAPGRTEFFATSLLRIQTPQGLQAGNISFSWRPDSSTVTVHKLLIHRGAQTIDVLGAGQSFTVVRRETNLENAVFDGVLTAAIQPEGLQVGDVIEFAATTASSDPSLKNHVEAMGAGWNRYAVSRARLRAEWPSSLPIRVRQTKALPAGRLKTEGGRTSFELTQDNLEPPVLPDGAPPRFALHRLVEFTDFGSWGELGALLAPYYEQAAALKPGAKLLDEAERIRRLSNDPKQRAEAALTLVQDRIRYVYLGMNDGGLVPADAETTWSRRFGDCKAKTVVLLALLEALGIEAEPVAVSLQLGDGLDARLPLVGQFDHVVVRATIAGKTYWLDGTRRGDRRLEAVRVPMLRWGLPLRGGATLVAIMPPPLDEPDALTTLRIDASKGVTAPAPAQAELRLSGDAAISINSTLANLGAEARDRALRAYWKDEFEFIEPAKAGFAFDADRQEARLTIDGTARLEWDRGRLWVPGSKLGAELEFKRSPSADAAAPYSVGYPSFTRSLTTIRLPKGFSAADVHGEDVDRRVGGVEYRRRSTLKDGVLTVETGVRSVAPEFPAAEVDDARSALKAFGGGWVRVHKPRGYNMTDAEIAAALDAKPDDAGEFIDRANLLLNRGRYDEALADIDQAVKLEPRNGRAQAMRGLILVWKQDFAAATKVLDAAEALAPRDAVIHRARGFMAQAQDKPAEAAAAYTTSLEIEPDSAFALLHRAQVLGTLGERDRALADAAAAIKLDPTWTEAYLLRANLLRRDKAKAVAEAEALLAANPDDPYAHVVAARIFQRFEMRDAAMKAVGRSLAIRPSALAYLARADLRPETEYAARIADLDQAARLDPKNLRPIAAKAEIQEAQGNYKAAIATWTQAAEADPSEGGFLVQRGLVHARLGQMALAEKDFTAGRAKATSADQLNRMCWGKATTGLALESALIDCNAALAKAPDQAAYLDSRGLVLLRLGRLDEAIASYDAALAKAPGIAASLFGRAVAWARKGDRTKSDADLAAALKADDKVQAEFKGYGVTL